MAQAPPQAPQVPPIPQQAQPNMAQLLTTITNEIRAIGLSEQVRKFSGEGTKKFKDWVRDIHRVSTSVGADPGRIRSLCLQTVTGLAADYLTRYITANPQATWAQIKQAMASVYADEADVEIASQKLRKIKQGGSESLQNFAERILSLAEDAYINENDQNPLVQKDLVTALKNGVKSDRIAQKIINQKPATFDRAIQIAFETQAQAKSFEVSRGREEQPMEVDSIENTNSRIDILEKQMVKVTDSLDTLVTLIKQSKIETQPKTFEKQTRPVEPQIQHKFTSDGKVICSYCSKIGHRMAECRKRKSDFLRQNQGN